MDELNRKRLEWMRDAPTGALFPKELFNTEESSCGWATAVAAACKAALDEIYRLELKLCLTQRHAVDLLAQSCGLWSPIATAPVKEWSESLPSYYRFRCLLQLETLTDGRPTVCEGYGYYVVKTARGGPLVYLRWHDGRHQCSPKYWMPLPAPKED